MIKLNRVEKIATFCILAIITLISGLLVTHWIHDYMPLTEPSSQVITEGLESRLIVDGFVLHPLNLTFDELAAMPKTTVNAELYCVNPPPRALSEGDWTGVRLGFILENAGITSEAIKVAFYAEDGFATDLTIATASREDVILAYEKDGEPLREKLRLVVPGKWGYKWIRAAHLLHIELVNYDFKGTYESRGYSDTADIPEGYSFETFR